MIRLLTESSHVHKSRLRTEVPGSHPAACRPPGGSGSAGQPGLLTERWNAKWIVAPGTNPFAYGVYHFRKTLDLTERPQRFVVHVTADNRYQLWVNGVRVVWGPARGDLNHWRYETVNLAAHLRPGRNVVAAVVWNYGELAPEAQTTWRTGFLIQGDSAAEKAVNSDETWKAARNPAYARSPSPTPSFAATSWLGRESASRERSTSGAGSRPNTTTRAGRRRSRSCPTAAPTARLAPCATRRIAGCWFRGRFR